MAGTSPWAQDESRGGRARVSPCLLFLRVVYITVSHLLAPEELRTDADSWKVVPLVQKK